MNNYTKAITHLKGWSDGAGSRPMNPSYTNPMDFDEAAAYNDGYALGRADRRRASDYSAAKFGVKFGESRLA